MDPTATLHSLAVLFPNLPDRPVEDLLVTFDALLGASDPSLRPLAAAVLRQTAESCQDPARRDRLLRAAAAVAAGEPCALTAAGLTAQQAAAAAHSIDPADWKDPEPPPPPADAVPDDSADDDEDDEDDSPYMEEAPPPLPHLRVRHFFPGMVVRVAQDFADVHGRAVCSGDVLNLLRAESTAEGCMLAFLERTIRLEKSAPSHGSILENAANAWFQPVPTLECAEALHDAIDLALGDLDEEDNDGRYTGQQIERLAALRDDLDRCGAWLHSEIRGPAPQLSTGPLAAQIFGRRSDLAVWIPLLFAVVAVA